MEDKLMKTIKAISVTLKKLRGEKTIEEVAKDLGISVLALTEYEDSECARIPRDEIKIRISNYYNVPVHNIFF